MMCTTCFPTNARFGAIESTTATGPSNVRSSPIPTSSASSRRSRLDEALAAVHSPAGQEPVLAAPGLLVPAEEDASLPAEDGRDPDARLERHQWAELPKPFSPRSLSGSSVTSRGSGRATGTTTSCAIRIPGSTTNGSVRSVFEQHDLELAAVAGVDEARRVQDRDAVPGRQARARLDEAGMTVGDRHGEAGRRPRRAPPGRARRARTPRDRGPRRRRKPASAASRRRGGVARVARSRALPAPSGSLLGDQVGRETAQLAAWQARDDEHALRACPRARRSGRRARRARSGVLPRRTAGGGGRARTARRSARRSAPAARRAPRR